jgi:hypothetical protein
LANADHCTVFRGGLTIIPGDHTAFNDVNDDDDDDDDDDLL